MEFKSVALALRSDDFAHIILGREEEEASLAYLNNSVRHPLSEASGRLAFK